MATSEISEVRLRLAARQAYERGRLQGAVLRGAGAAALVLPAFFVCNARPLAALCVLGFALVIAAGRLRGERFEAGTRAGALAGVLPCLLPAAVRTFDSGFCAYLCEHGPLLCAFGGLAAGAILGMRGRAAGGWPYWSGAIAALIFAGSLGCLPAGAMGFAGLAAGVVAAGAPVLVARRGLV